MKEFLDIIRNVYLFRGMTDQNIVHLLDCTGYSIKKYQANEQIFCVGDFIASLGIVLKGHVLVSQSDYWGNQNIINKISACGLFAEAFALSGNTVVGVNAIAEKDVQVMWISADKILYTFSKDYKRHAQVIDNLIKITAQKNIFLNQKIGHLSKRTTREKLLAYLSDQSIQQGTPKFDIMFNRQQLADYLSVDRSAMSSELSKLQNEGYIKYHKNKFELLSNREN